MQMRRWIVVGGIATSLVLAGSALAHRPRVEGNTFRALGTTVTKTSFREKERAPGQITIEFNEDTFEALVLY